MNAPVHIFNFIAGWALILCAFLCGAGIGLFFHREDFWGGYGSFRRRIVRLGHVALAALGMLNLLFAMSPWPAPGTVMSRIASILLICGGVAMPTTCFLTGWRPAFRNLFIIPVLFLISAVIFILLGAKP